ncbi:glutamine-hydrolyzing carbamoyl-phosphate synthase small subunit [Wenyingzhuangia sp. 2_MG-2023]|uniref:glutamine-hydrolyzing carbamoyl-phosphate synthase small subunit n=1 Tax=Wenyingzhuangia sp. 2_MG-2023 TaxID=3062639 RepID=UPI0026E248BF|nr:glutamine-hydrolyzing carbamoyl-phosphate synthase small subunit [Wenyingzhuangia sp. 2_MG-2023]MDO6738443.1 glutamine-hydrolyzing carbamoyl-phosphate synthase small subunit [Wenyingzhuangia sp. 2_MG-2023]
MKYKELKKAILLLEDGTIFEGKSVGVEGTTIGEICYNTGMTGYQEIFTDPSYFGQIMVATNAHIGNYGVNDDEVESDGIKIAGLVCRNFSFEFSRDRSNGSLEEYFTKQGLISITDVDTRAVVSYIRENGAMNAAISTEIDDIDALKAKLAEAPSMKGLDLASVVSTKEPYFYGDENATYKVSALDLGIKKNILRNLAKRDCFVKVFPCTATFEEMAAFNPDGYFLSNGPGDPEPLESAQKVAKEIVDKELTLFGICLGHQIIALSQGIATYKMHNGHRGINHPIKNLITGKGEITSQNHGFNVSREDVEATNNVEITHVHLNDNTVAGIAIKDKKVFSVQYHPEANPGPHDASYLFDQFIDNMKK